VERLERVADEFAPGGRFEVAGEQLGVERRLGEQHPDRAVARVEGDDGADLAGHGRDRLALEGEVEGDLERATGHRRLVVELGDLAAERVDDDDEVARRAAEPVVVGALEARAPDQLPGVEAGVGRELAGVGLAELAGEVRDARPVRERAPGRRVDLELRVLARCAAIAATCRQVRLSRAPTAGARCAAPCRCGPRRPRRGDLEPGQETGGARRLVHLLGEEQELEHRAVARTMSHGRR